MSVESNESNVKDSKNKRYNYLFNYISKSKRKREKTYLLRLDPEVYEEFRRVASAKFGLHYGANVLVEALIKMFIDEFKDSPLIQATLFYKPKIEKVEVKQEINIAQKLELKLVTQNLTWILENLEKKRGDQSFLLARLKEVLPKALRLYEKIESKEIAELLERADKWI